MTKQSRYVLAVAAVTLAFGTLAWYDARHHADVQPGTSTRSAFDRIRPGMTAQEVEALLGGAPTGNIPHFAENNRLWKRSVGEIWVRFGQDGRVQDKTFVQMD